MCFTGVLDDDFGWRGRSFCSELHNFSLKVSCISDHHRNYLCHCQTWYLLLCNMTLPWFLVKALNYPAHEWLVQEWQQVHVWHSSTSTSHLYLSTTQVKVPGTTSVPFCHPINSVKTLKGTQSTSTNQWSSPISLIVFRSLTDNLWARALLSNSFC